jgi:very-short-patch-repair endonuclease
MANPLARAMRRRLTDAEMRLWFHLRPMRQHGLAFRRQSPVGAYILDFECRRAKLGVELDGAQHEQEKARESDAARTAWLSARGYEILRFSNHNVLTRTDEIVAHIMMIARRRAEQLERPS